MLIPKLNQIKLIKTPSQLPPPPPHKKRSASKLFKFFRFQNLLSFKRTSLLEGPTGTGWELSKRYNSSFYPLPPNLL
jgi:hypothetical protein